jgi:hypothetical protein
MRRFHSTAGAEPDRRQDDRPAVIAQDAPPYARFWTREPAAGNRRAARK